MNPGTYRFSDFELDSRARCLRRNGREVQLQPRVFDLLLYLLENTGRVVSKNELMDALWPDVVVTESSLHRAISLARSALQGGSKSELIRSYPGRGYRFVTDDETEANPALHTGSMRALAQDCYNSNDWQGAIDAFSQADRQTPLNAECLEHWGIAAQCIGDLAAASAPLERAATAFEAGGDSKSAARALVNLARVRLEALDFDIAQGYLRRARRLLSALPACEEHGHLEWMTSRFHLNSGELDLAVQTALQARDIGRALHSPDIESAGLLMLGIALQAQGKLREGLELQNEAAAIVLSGNVTALVGGIVYCGIVSSCCNGGDWRRAEQWSTGFSRWCKQNHVDAFAGACLVHQAEVDVMSGKLNEAMEAMHRADPLIRVGAPWASGELHRLMGDVQLARGEIDAAEQSYLLAYQNGRDPYPGYAQLLHDRGKTGEAINGLKRAATLNNWVSAQRKARFLACAAQIAASAGHLETARELLAKLDQEPLRWNTGAAIGEAECARAEILRAEGQTEDAVAAFRRAADALKQNGAIMDAANVHLRLAELLSANHQSVAANLELHVAENIFQTAGAAGSLERCRKIRATLHKN